MNTSLTKGIEMFVEPLFVLVTKARVFEEKLWITFAFATE